jgi:hypothetical protein
VGYIPGERPIGDRAALISLNGPQKHTVDKFLVSSSRTPSETSNPLNNESMLDGTWRMTQGYEAEIYVYDKSGVTFLQ